MPPPRSVMLFGTDEPVEEMATLKAGPLEARLDAGNLRHIRIGGVEALRGVAFLVRDRNWGTYAPEISDLRVAQSAEGFTVVYNAVCRDAEQSLRYSARIDGRTDGGLAFVAEGEALEEFATCRAGFVVLHPLEGVVGRRVRVEHIDGRVVDERFPELIDPACPIQDIRALTHEIAPGVSARCVMEGDAYEMEDHRNWMDASYKTYIRPLAKPWPYTIQKGERLEQKVEMTIMGAPSAPAIASPMATTVKIGMKVGAASPRIGLAVPAEHAGVALDAAELLRGVGADHLVCRFDPRAGDGRSEIRRFAELGEALAAELVLEAVVPCLDADGAPTDDLEVMKRDMEHIRAAAKGVGFAHVAVSPAADLKSTPPGSTYPPAPSWAELFSAARAAFPLARLGGGMFSYFTELNRKRPPVELLDFICHSGSPIVHAGDDLSVMENLEATPWIFRSARSFAGDTPYWIFPTAISMRDNPYGAAPAENPGDIRQAMNRVDPRDRGLFGAAWRVGYAARAARAGVAAMTLGAAAGPSGVTYARQPHRQAGSDEGERRVTPSYMVLSELAACAGGAVLDIEGDDGRAVAAMAVATPRGRRMLLANLTAAEQTVRVEGALCDASSRVLDETSFESFCADPESLRAASVDLAALRLRPHAVAAIALD